MQFFLDFEKPIVELEQKIKELRDYSTDSVDFSSDIKKLEKKADKLREEIFSNLTRWQRTQLARHQNRPYTLDYINHIFTDWFEVHGDRNYRDDPALVCGFARLDGESCVVIGHQKGRDTKEKVYRNFGMPNPEGYRKALRVMQMAEQFGLPIFTFIDTPGAFPGIGAEERGQAEAIARNLREMAALTVPIIVTVTGEGGSGGALDEQRGVAADRRCEVLAHPGLRRARHAEHPRDDVVGLHGQLGRGVRVRPDGVGVVGAMGIAFGAVLTIYLVIPTDGPTFRQAFWPAVIVGVTSLMSVMLIVTVSTALVLTPSPTWTPRT